MVVVVIDHPRQVAKRLVFANAIWRDVDSRCRLGQTGLKCRRAQLEHSDAAAAKAAGSLLKLVATGIH